MDDHTKRIQKRSDPRAMYLRVLDGLFKGNSNELREYFAHERPEVLEIITNTLVHNPRSRKILGRYFSAMHAVASQKEQVKPESLDELMRASGEVAILHTHFVEANSAATNKSVKLAGDYKKKKDEAEKAERRMYDLAMTDALTGVKNRLFFMEEITRIHHEAQNYRDQPEEAYSMIHVDLDHFKEANDTYGHPAGDAALKAFVSRVKDAMLTKKHPQDKFTRFGGDEFAFILPRTQEKGAQKLAERVLALMNALPVQYGEHAFNIGTSIGVWQYQPGDTVDDVITAADNCMYIAKKVYQGNHVVTGSMAAAALKADDEKGIEIREKLSPAFKERLLRYSSEPKKI